MTDPILFLLAVLGLLAVPGPTNTLLALGGATAGLRDGWRLVPAEVAGYLVAITLLTLMLGPLIAAEPWVAGGLRLACALYLAYLAQLLWRWRPASAKRAPVHPLRVFLATLTNPKAIVLAFGIFPATAGRAPLDVLAGLAPWLGGFAAICLGVGCAWVALGAGLRRTAADERVRLFHRGAAIVIASFALALSLQGA